MLISIQLEPTFFLTQYKSKSNSFKVCHNIRFVLDDVSINHIMQKKNLLWEAG